MADVARSKANSGDAQLADRRSRRAAGQEVFDTLAQDYLGRSGVSRGPMFGSEGLMANGKFFAFVGRSGDLVLKLSETQTTALVEAGEATAVRAGRRRRRRSRPQRTPLQTRRCQQANFVVYRHHALAAMRTDRTGGRPDRA
jgi:hypothetical protein